MPKIFLIKNRLHQQQLRLLESQHPSKSPPPGSGKDSPLGTSEPLSLIVNKDQCSCAHETIRMRKTRCRWPVTGDHHALQLGYLASMLGNGVAPLQSHRDLRFRAKVTQRDLQLKSAVSDLRDGQGDRAGIRIPPWHGGEERWGINRRT
ncbi:hypothetical protein G5I_10451 [Acromyrmex echinatior]|uniref:Uncharacterized protein n=1 Tax=Acromyrmex echinatior TaxID=103372 RepID=F4WX81_ACREC|nr:hypothetical protein G5I_10451 [Acromyrmex echinatior]